MKGCPACLSDQYLEYRDEVEFASLALEEAESRFNEAWKELRLLIKPLR